MATELEAQGWHIWLKTLFPFAFDEEFSDDHRKYWNLRWSVLLRIREQQRCVAAGLDVPDEYLIGDDEYVALLILGRGLAKSSSLEAAAVMRGALLDGGYCLYISEAQDQAEEHVGNCQGLINHEDSKLLGYYPRMAILDDATVGGIKTKNRTDIFITSNGWICRAKGLNSKLRGLRIGIQRPDDIKLDDVDGVNDSIDVSVKKLKQITSSVLPTQARRWATIDFGQNLIIETGAMNQLFTGQSDALAKRHTIGITKTFSVFDYESRIDAADGKLKHYILPTSIPTWKGVNIAQAQKFLHDSGLITFLAEYQNDFEKAKEGRVLRNYNDALMVITEEDFKRVFGPKHTLDTFNKYPGHDWAKTKNAYHACVAGTLAVSNQNSPLPGKLFLCNLLSFEEGTIADDVGLKILETISPTVPGRRQTWKQLIEASTSRVGLERFTGSMTRLLEAQRDVLADVIPPIVGDLLERLNYSRFRGSHDENNGALEVYRHAYGLPFEPCNPGKTGGLEWAHHYMTIDKKTRHPFFEDELQADGAWKLGCPGFFIIVKKEKFPYPKTATPDALHGSDLCRYEFNNWRNAPLKLTANGVIEFGPMKMNDNFGNMLQMILLGNKISARSLTREETVVALTPEPYRYDSLLKRSPYENGLDAKDEMTYIFHRDRARKEAGRSGIQEFDLITGDLIEE